MNPKVFFSLLLTICWIGSSSLCGQNRILKKIERKAKQKLEQRAERKVDQAMDKGLDKIEGAVDKSVKGKTDKKKESSTSSSSDASATNTEATSMPSTQKNEEESRIENEALKEGIQTPSRKAPNSPQAFSQTNFGNEPIRTTGTIGKGPYGIGSGMFIQTTQTSHEMMEGKTRDTVYFDNFGQLQARYQHSTQEINMMGIKRREESRLIAIHRNDSIYSHDPGKRKGYVMKNPAQAFYQGMSEQDMQRLGQEVEQGMNTTHERLGTERVAGKLCEVFEYTSHTEEGEVMMITRMWWWNGMNLKSISRGMGTEVHQEMILLKDEIKIDKGRFIPNPNINYQSFSLGNY